VEAARSGPDALAEQCGIRGAQAAGLIAAGERLFRELEEQTIGKAVDILLDVAPQSGQKELKKLEDLSKGQRATALLLLLLGASDSPLIIDQPEDDLDNRFVYDGVVQRLRELKGKRQVIVSTHNANIPVLGDAELVIGLEGNGTHSWPIADGIGSLDSSEIRCLAEDLLEGGRTAFEARQDLYGF
jgi:ABC-type Mn2+/Zn2+ transport system ATPase subunit